MHKSSSFSLVDVLADIGRAVAAAQGPEPEPPCPDGYPEALSGKRLYLISQHLQGLSNQLTSISGAYAKSCDLDATAVSISWMFGTFGADRARLDGSTFLDLNATNQQLLSRFRCRGKPPPILLPRKCALEAVSRPLLNVTLICNQKVYSPATRLGIGRPGFHRLAAANPVLATFVPRAAEAFGWIAFAVTTPGLHINHGVRLALAGDSFYALQVNLDVDWLLFRVDSSLNNNKSKKGNTFHPQFYFGDESTRLRMARDCCSQDRPSTNSTLSQHRAVLQRFVKKAHRTIADAVRQYFVDRRRPILLVTSIGKDPKYNMTEWLLSDLIDLLDGYSFFVGRSHSTWVGLNAAAELSAASRAHTFLSFPGSQFGWMVQIRLQERGRAGLELPGELDPLALERSKYCLNCKLISFPSLSELQDTSGELSTSTQSTTRRHSPKQSRWRHPPKRSRSRW